MDQKPISGSKKTISQWKAQYGSDVLLDYLGNRGLLELLMKKYDLKEIPFDSVDQRIQEALFENSNYLDDSFRIFTLMNNTKSVLYYAEEEPETTIKIIIGNNQYLFCDNTHLYLDMFILRGIKREDYEAENWSCLEYLSKIDQRNELLSDR